MKKSLIVVLIFCVLLVGACSPAVTPTPTSTPTSAPTDTPTVTPSETPAGFTLSSPIFTNGGSIPEVYSCNGDSKSPELTWNEPPAGTQTFALIMDDPDAGGYSHWVIFNIPADYRGLPENVERGRELEKGIFQGMSGPAVFGYVGPCPPSGTHHYSFTLYALDTTFTKEQGAGKSFLLTAMEGHILGKSELIGLYQP
jgi:Raf kinase inhibitor-like YbhB/YbcL family protein